MYLMQPVVYRVDHEDRFDAFNEGWLDFAAANGGDALHPSQIGGRRLWDFVSGETTAGLYHAMMLRVRQGGAPIAFQFRCDAPDRRRLLSMDIRAESSGAVEFTVRSIAEEARIPVPLLDASRPRAADLLTICAWCKRAKLGRDRWGEVEEAIQSLQLFVDHAPLPGLTHGMCPDCHTAITARIERGEDSATLGSLPAIVPPNLRKSD